MPKTRFLSDQRLRDGIRKAYQALGDVHHNLIIARVHADTGMRPTWQRVKGVRHQISANELRSWTASAERRKEQETIAMQRKRLLETPENLSDLLTGSTSKMRKTVVDNKDGTETTTYHPGERDGGLENCMGDSQLDPPAMPPIPKTPMDELFDAAEELFILSYPFGKTKYHPKHEDMDEVRAQAERMYRRNPNTGALSLLELAAHQVRTIKWMKANRSPEELKKLGLSNES